MVASRETFPIVGEPLSKQPVNGKINPGQNSDVTYVGEPMPPRRHEDDDNDDYVRELIAREIRRSQNGNGVATGRSVDTLRRDIGIFAILLGMMVQTGAAFYWAGGVSKQIEAQKEQFQQIQAEQAYQRAQNQILDGQQKKAEARQEERDRLNGKGK